MIKLDAEIQSTPEAGQTTAILALITPNSIKGASIGDSRLYVLSNELESPQHLTAGQQQKPLAGTGASLPIPFQQNHRRETIVAATDGFWKYGGHQVLQEFNSGDALPSAKNLIDQVRLSSGQLRDDTCVAVLTYR